MQAQIRIYTINKGELDTFIKHFKEETKPIHDKVGWPIVASWVNRPQNEFIWIRTYENAADLEAKAKACVRLPDDPALWSRARPVGLSYTAASPCDNTMNWWRV
jgi:hypothetical protein